MCVCGCLGVYALCTVWRNLGMFKSKEPFFRLLVVSVAKENQDLRSDIFPRVKRVEVMQKAAGSGVPRQVTVSKTSTKPAQEVLDQQL